MPEQADIAVIGAGAAGLMAAISAGRAARAANRPLRIVALDGAKVLGAKILVAGGGRCNVTHDEVDETAFAGSSRNAIRKVLGRFDVSATLRFFGELGVECKREETGKLFPITDNARTILDALLRAAKDAGVELLHPWRVDSVTHDDSGFLLTQAAPPDTPASDPSVASSLRRSVASLSAPRLILATGGMSLPKTGSDGRGYSFARALGHTVTRTFPGLVPLTLPEGHFLRELSGITLPATLELRAPTGKRLVSFTDSTLLTHFGLSGPSVLDISRYYLAEPAAPLPPQQGRERAADDHPKNDATASLHLNFLPGETAESLDATLAAIKNHGPATYLATRLPTRLAEALCRHAGIVPYVRGHQLAREPRRALARAVCELPLPITGSRGYTFAEVTAGGVPLSEVRLESMESRVCPGLHLCGEILDVDGRIGGYNFQWAWASGHVAGRAAAE